MNPISSCPLCTQDNETILWSHIKCRVIQVSDPAYPAFCRVIWQNHIREMSDLSPEDQQGLMQVVLAVERVLRDLLSPDKINLASFGNMVPHLHWHIIPRWKDDRHFPEPIWGTPQRECINPHAVSSETLRTALNQRLAAYPPTL